MCNKLEFRIYKMHYTRRAKSNNARSRKWQQVDTGSRFLVSNVNFDIFCKRNFPMNSHVRLMIRWLADSLVVRAVIIS